MDPSIYQENHPPNIGLQGLSFRRGHARWYRSSSHDPEETITNKPYFTIQTVRKLGCLNVAISALRMSRKTLRQNLTVSQLF